MVSSQEDAGSCGATGMAGAEDMGNRRCGLCHSWQQEPRASRDGDTGLGHGWPGRAVQLVASIKEKCQRQAGCKVPGGPVLDAYLCLKVGRYPCPHVVPQGEDRVQGIPWGSA